MECSRYHISSPAKWHWLSKIYRYLHRYLKFTIINSVLLTLPCCLDWISPERELLLLQDKSSESISISRGISWRSAVCSFWGYCMTEFIFIKPEEYLLSGNFHLLCELDLEWFPAPARECPFHQKRDLRRFCLMQEREIKGEFIWTAMFWGHNLDLMWSELLQQKLSVHSSVCQEQYVHGVPRSGLGTPLSEGSWKRSQVALWRAGREEMGPVLGQLRFWDLVFDGSLQIGTGMSSKTWCPPSV